MKKLYAILALTVFMPLGSASAADDGSAHQNFQTSDGVTSMHTVGSWQTTITRAQSEPKAWKKPHSIGRRGARISTLRAQAISISMRHLPRLRPYASNYPRMVRAVRAYWRANISNPSAARLTNTIMQHVQAKYRFLVRGRVRTGIAKGISALKRKLRKS